ncbi:hypothetical protein KO527_05430 [Pseudoalteromonas sp. C2R02]|uniref:hypothetical protein n=1 Tax=Pseudoalteromonas sp. C2R02 TaxID=2841565 RepID=UPI001C0822FD|nr:hypothetical protein [Pseudoalteromonas sp. C2R02]MBU2968790.1 hypothetical protein [Pseudoalteromonas sp. C2R02]
MADATLGRRKRGYQKHKAQTYQQQWAFRVVVPDSTIDFDLFAKDITYGAVEIEGEAKVIGGGTYTEPVSAAPVILGVTIRDNELEEFATWFDAQAAKIINPNGTKNLPVNYLFNIEVYSILKNDTEKLRHTWKVYAASRGDRTESVDDLGTYVSYPVTFQQYYSLG